LASAAMASGTGFSGVDCKRVARCNIREPPASPAAWNEEYPLASELEPTRRIWLRRIGEHKVVTGAATTVLATAVLGGWGALSGWITADDSTTAPTNAAMVVGPAGQAPGVANAGSGAANFEPLGFGTDFGPDDLPGGRRAEPGQTLEICPDEPLIGWFLHDLAAGSSLRLRWLHEGETIRVETYEVSTAATWYRVDEPVAAGQYLLEVQAGSGEQASWSVYAQAVDETDEQCDGLSRPEASPTGTP
jgi:hypothetical protein